MHFKEKERPCRIWKQKKEHHRLSLKFRLLWSFGTSHNQSNARGSMWIFAGQCEYSRVNVNILTSPATCVDGNKKWSTSIQSLATCCQRDVVAPLRGHGALAKSLNLGCFIQVFRCSTTLWVPLNTLMHTKPYNASSLVGTCTWLQEEWRWSLYGAGYNVNISEVIRDYVQSDEICMALDIYMLKFVKSYQLWAVRRNLYGSGFKQICEVILNVLCTTHRLRWTLCGSGFANIMRSYSLCSQS